MGLSLRKPGDAAVEITGYSGINNERTAVGEQRNRPLVGMPMRNLQRTAHHGYQGFIGTFVIAPQHAYADLVVVG
ncbi:hypothetical protein D3C76_1471530 [compost metagenome]